MSESGPTYPLLERVEGPADLRQMSPDQLRELACELRTLIIETVSRTGGHLGASLGAVELTIALHAELDSPRDKILWDVGHQAYGHKLLTGRRDSFGTLRQHGGVSGFLRRSESAHDVMGAGHASTAISYATGLAEAQRRSDRAEGHVVCVVGDGALTGGMAYEGLNQAGHLGSPIKVILNDNGMSISPNVGALSALFQKTRVDPTFHKMWEGIERGLARLPGVAGVGGQLKDATKAFFVPGHLFESLGFVYLGPIDGHDIEAVREAIRRSLEVDRPVVVHLHTIKGKGYGPAEADGEAMHGATPFVVANGKAAKASSGPPGYTEVFGRALVEEARRDVRVVGITAAMLKGTGIAHLEAALPDRAYDVGIAEQHAVVFACGLAIAGMRPVCAIYSTFLQRAFDPIVHDVAIQHLPVVFAIDRGGLVGDDGATHHGILDIAYLRGVPGMTLMAPMNEVELVDMLRTALTLDGPSAFRYPRGAATGLEPRAPQLVEIGRGEVLQEGERVALVGYGYGALVARGAAADIEEALGTPPTVVNARFCKPLDTELMRRVAAEHELVVTIEDHAVLGGFGSAVQEALGELSGRVLRIGLPDRFIDHGRREILLEEVGLTPPKVAARAVRALAPAARALRA
jgi:1-deoxy-D-xylulose-5-phosphate synthase